MRKFRMMEHIALGGWIWLKNLRPFIDTIASLNRYQLLDSEWEAIRFGVEGSDSDADPPQWFSYSFVGEYTCVLDLGHDKGTNVLQVRLKVPSTLEAKVSMMIELMSRYGLSFED